MCSWHDISNVVNHKRIFNIECTAPEKSVGFSLPDADTGRYFWKLCVLQHTFFMKFEQNQINPNVEQNFNLFQNVPEDLNESRDNLFVEPSNIYASDSHISQSLMWNHSSSQPHQYHHQQAESAVSSNMSLAASHQQLRNGISEQNWTPVPSDYSHRNSNWALIGSNTSLNNNRTQSTSCLDLSNNNVHHERERLKAFLPGYRQAPDYETAVQQKYRSSETELRMNTSMLLAQNAGIASDTHINIYSGSHPDVHQATAVTDAIFGQQLQQKYPDVTQTTNPIYQHFADPNFVGIDGLSHQLQMMRFNKPPPPYQANRLSSTSTPDLASHRLLGYRAYVSGSSPDLVSTRTFLNQQPQFMSQQQVYPASNPSQAFRYRYSQNIVPHGTYENLSFVDNTKTNLLSQKLQQNAYRNQSSTLNNGLLKSSQHHNGSIEPIYENIPLPWQCENSSQAEMRDRASSIQSAPGVMRFKTPQPQPTNQQSNKSPHLNESNNNFTISNTSLTTMTDLKNNNMAEHTMLSKSTSNPIDQHHKYANNDGNHDIVDSLSGSNGVNVISVNSSTATNFEPHIEIIQPPKQFQQNDKPVHRTRIEITAANHNNIITATSNNTNDKGNRSHSVSNVLETSQSSTFTNQTATTTDSGVDVGQKEKKKRRWAFFGGGSNSKPNSNDKQKSATLGREKEKEKQKDKDKSSKNKTISRDEQNKQRWSTGLPRLQPLAATISKEKLVREQFKYSNHFGICHF